jgi:hypothetical protein
MSFLFVAGLGPGSFNLGNVVPPIFVISLALTIFLALQERVSRSSPWVKVSLGVILVLLAVINSYYLVGFINFFLDEFLYRDSALYFILPVFIIGMLVSLWYFSHQKFQRRPIVTIHALAVVLFMIFFIFQFANVRKHQALVLQTCQEFRQAIEQRNYESAYQLMSPAYRKTHTVDDLLDDDYFLSHATEEIDSIYTVEYTFWRNEAYIITGSYFTPTPTFWARPTDGVSLDLEYVDGRWLLTGQTAFNFIE